MSKVKYEKGVRHTLRRVIFPPYKVSSRLLPSRFLSFLAVLRKEKWSGSSTKNHRLDILKVVGRYYLDDLRGTVLLGRKCMEMVQDLVKLWTVLLVMFYACILL